MKWLEWIVVGGFIVLGLACLMMSALWAAPFMTLHMSIYQLALICFWVFLPLGAFLLLFYVIIKR